jgi:hypothetical protein
MPGIFLDAMLLKACRQGHFLAADGLLTRHQHDRPLDVLQDGLSIVWKTKCHNYFPDRSPRQVKKKLIEDFELKIYQTISHNL